MLRKSKFVLLLAGITAFALLLAIAGRAYSASTPVKPVAPFSMGAVDYLGSLQTPADVKGRPSGFKRFVNKVLGLEDDSRRMVLPHGVAIDASGRVLVADTKGQVVH